MRQREACMQLYLRGTTNVGCAPVTQHALQMLPSSPEIGASSWCHKNGADCMAGYANTLGQGWALAACIWATCSVVHGAARAHPQPHVG